jgi:hypothetical protein
MAYELLINKSDKIIKALPDASSTHLLYVKNNYEHIKENISTAMVLARREVYRRSHHLLWQP